MDNLNAMVLKLLDEYAAIAAVSNSPSDRLAAIQDEIDALRAAYVDIHASVHGEQPDMVRPPHPHALTEDEAIAMIVAAGYIGPTNLVAAGHSWHASATDSTGATVALVVDGHGGVHLDTDAPDAAAVERPAYEPLTAAHDGVHS